DEKQLLRVEHFLQRQPVSNISSRRFVYAHVEPTCRREHLAGVGVTMAVTFGVPDPGVRLTLLSKGSNGRASRDVRVDLSLAARTGHATWVPRTALSRRDSGPPVALHSRERDRSNEATRPTLDRPATLSRETRARVVGAQECQRSLAKSRPVAVDVMCDFKD
ncbi:MAG: hypothetical protein ACYCPT_01135, partial [Acidimicrobiales bacterium]